MVEEEEKEKEREEDVQKWWVPLPTGLLVTEFFSPSVFGSWVFLGVHSSREDLNRVA